MKKLLMMIKHPTVFAQYPLYLSLNFLERDTKNRVVCERKKQTDVDRRPRGATCCLLIGSRLSLSTRYTYKAKPLGAMSVCA